MENASDKIRKSIYWKIGLSASWQVIQFAFSVIIARILDPVDFGIMGIASIFVFYSNSITQLGFNLALIQKKEVSQDHVDTVFTIDLLISFVFTLLALGSASYLAKFFSIPELSRVIMIISPVFLITCFTEMPLVLLKRSISFKVISIIELSRGITQAVSTLCFALLGYRYLSLVYGLILGYIIIIPMLIVKSKWRPRASFKLAAAKDLLSFGGYSLVQAQIFHLSEYSDKLVIAKWLGPTLLGFYEKAYSVAIIPINVVSMSIGGIMFSGFSRKQEDYAALRSYFSKSLTVNSLLCIPAVCGMSAVATHFVFVLFGPKWEGMVTTLRILALAYSFRPMISIINSINMGVGEYKSNIRARVLCLILFVLMCVVLVGFGIEAVALGLVLNNAIIVLTTFKITNRRIGIHWLTLFTAALPAFSGALVMSLGVCLASATILAEKTVLNLALLVLLGAILYTAWIVVVPFKECEFFKQDIRQWISGRTALNLTSKK